MSLVTETYTLLNRIDEIQQAMKNNMWQSALALSLTIPDICGQIEFSDLVQRRKDGTETRLVGQQYKAWFKKHVEPYFLVNLSTYENVIEDKSCFTAEMCWQLRNAFLHQGSDIVKPNSEKENFNFELQPSNYGSARTFCFSVDCSEFSKVVQIGIQNLCTLLCDCGKNFYSSWDNKEDFEDKKCVLKISSPVFERRKKWF